MPSCNNPASKLSYDLTKLNYSHMSDKDRKITKVKKAIHESKVGTFILSFFEILFKFIVDLLKVVRDLIKTVLWIAGLGLSVVLIATLVLFLITSTLGLKDSLVFQNYRDYLISEATQPQIQELENRQLVKDYIKANINDISPIEAVNGGTWYVLDIRWFGPNRFKVYAEDGHIQNYFTASYRVEDGQVSLENITSQN